MTAQASFIFLAAVALLSLLGSGLALFYARGRGMIDVPGSRSSHTIPTPRGGGAGIVLALLVAGVWVWFAFSKPSLVALIIPLMLVLSLTGWWDDHSSLSVRLRFLLQLICCATFIAAGKYLGWIEGAYWMALVLLFMVWMTNLYNFMDGSNGMAGLQGVFAGGVLACLFWLSGDVPAALMAAGVAAACLGFLPWNLYRPRIFMGDVGSLPLGFLLGALLVYGFGSGAFSLPVALMVMALFLVDASLTLLLRVMRGERWYNAHKQHLYQRLIAQGWNHEYVAALYMGINVCLLLPALVIATRQPQVAWFLAIALYFLLSVGWAVSIMKVGVNAAAE